MASVELYEAERGLLQAQTTLEYAQALVDYNQNRINRLRPLVETLKSEDAEIRKHNYPNPPPNLFKIPMQHVDSIGKDAQP